MSFVINYYSLSLFLGGVVSLFAGLFVFLDDSKKRENIAWLLLNFSTAIWSFGYQLMSISNTKGLAVFSDETLHVGAILIPIFYFLFIISLTKVYQKYKDFFYTFSVAGLFFLVVSPLPAFVRDVFQKGPFNFAPDAGPLYIYFTAYFFGIVIFSLVILFMQIRRSEKSDAIRLRFVLLSSIAGFLGGGSVFFLTFNVPIYPFPIVLFSFYPLIIAYAMLKYSLFNVKIVATEFLTGTLWIILLFRTVLAQNIEDQIISGIVLILTMIFGVLLIKTVYREVKQREKIESLAKQLDSLVHLVSHEVKGALGKNRDAFAAILEGDLGEATEPMKKIVAVADDSTKHTVEMVMDILNSSNAKNGTLAMYKKPFDMKVATEEVVASLMSEAQKKGLALNIEIPGGVNYTIDGDREKIVQHVIRNLVDNSIRYTPSGSVTVILLGGIKDPKNLKAAKSVVLLSIKDTGVGITPEDMSHLFTEGGRGKESVKVNVHSTGYGLFFAKNIVDAHGGKVWAESQGAGKGSQFYVEFPANVGISA